MNKAAPTSEKKRSKNEIDFNDFRFGLLDFNFTNSLVNWGVHDVAGEQSDEDDGVADEGSIDKHNVVTIVELIQAVVVQDHARDGDDLKESKHKFGLNSLPLSNH